MDDLFRVALAIIMLTGFPMLFYAGFVGIRVFQRRMEKGSVQDSELALRVEELERRLFAVEQVEGRLAEVEERVDFAERMLTRDKPVPQINGER
jgi:hypothetical protein